MANLKAESLWPAYALECAVLSAVAAMELRGIGFDSAVHDWITADWQRKQDTADARYRETTGGQAPPSTPAQKRDLIRQTANAQQLQAWKRTPKTKSYRRNALACGAYRVILRSTR
jgi:hypothetical protein